MKDRKFKRHPAVQRVEYLGALGLFYAARAIPLRAVGRVARGIGSLAFALLRSHRERAIQHLLYAGVASSRGEATRIARKSFQSLVLSLLECVKFDQHLQTVGGDPEACVHILDPQYAALREHKGAGILIACHYGNWELATRIFKEALRPFHVVVRRRHNPQVDALLSRWRDAEAESLIDHRKAPRALLRALRANHVVVMAVDQRSKPREGIEARFFGHPALTHTAPAQLHLRTDAPIFLGVARRLDAPFAYQVVIRGPFEIERSGDRKRDIAALTQLYTDEIEAIIREDPSQWVWAHRRWHDHRHEELSTRA